MRIRDRYQIFDKGKKDELSQGHIYSLANTLIKSLEKKEINSEGVSEQIVHVGIEYISKIIMHYEKEWESYFGTVFSMEKYDGHRKSETNSYLLTRKLMQDAGQIMGFDNQRKLNELERKCQKIVNKRKLKEWKKKEKITCNKVIL